MALTVGTLAPCEQRSGGLVEVFLADRDDIVTFILTGSLYSAVTMVGGKVFKKFEFEIDTAERRETGTLENGSTSILHEIEFFVPKLTQANRDALQDVFESSACGMIGIVKDANGTLWVVGFSENNTNLRPLKVTNDATLSGKLFTDLTGSTLTLGSTDNEKDRTFTGTVPV